MTWVGVKQAFLLLGQSTFWLILKCFNWILLWRPSRLECFVFFIWKLMGVEIKLYHTLQFKFRRTCTDHCNHWLLLVCISRLHASSPNLLTPLHGYPATVAVAVQPQPKQISFLLKYWLFLHIRYFWKAKKQGFKFILINWFLINWLIN